MGIFDPFRLDGRVALLTGAGRGIGLSIARALAEAGARVVIQELARDVAAQRRGRVHHHRREDSGGWRDAPLR